MTRSPLNVRADEPCRAYPSARASLTRWQNFASSGPVNTRYLGKSLGGEFIVLSSSIKCLFNGARPARSRAESQTSTLFRPKPHIAPTPPAIPAAIGPLRPRTIAGRAMAINPNVKRLRRIPIFTGLSQCGQHLDFPSSFISSENKLMLIEQCGHFIWFSLMFRSDG